MHLIYPGPGGNRDLEASFVLILYKDPAPMREHVLQEQKQHFNCNLCSLELQLSFLPYRPVKGLAEQMESAFKPSYFVRPEKIKFQSLLLFPHRSL